MNKLSDINLDAARGVMDNVFDNFNFEKVKKTMDALNWQWGNLQRYDPNNDFKLKICSAVPTLEEIMQFAANLMMECAETDIDVIATGGFRVEKDFNDPNDPWMRLSFEVESYEDAID